MVLYTGLWNPSNHVGSSLNDEDRNNNSNSNNNNNNNRRRTKNEHGAGGQSHERQSLLLVRATSMPHSHSQQQQQQQQQQHVPGKFPSISGDRAAEYPEEDQKISPSMFDSSSCSDYSDLADNDAPPRPPAITKMARQHQTTPAPAHQHPPLQQQQQHPKSTLDSTVFHLKTSGSFTHGFPSSASRDERARVHGDSRGMQQHSSNHHHLHHLQRNYLEAIMLLEQKNGLHDQQQPQGSPYHNNPSSSQRRRPGDGRRPEE